MARQPRSTEGEDLPPDEELPDRGHGDQAAIPDELAVFGACDPSIQEKLLGEGLHLLRHMNIDDSVILGSEPPPQTDAPINPRDIEALLRWLEEAAPAATPDLLEGSPLERLWILLDMSVASSGLARQRATHALRTSMQDLRGRGGMSTDQLEELSRVLQTNEDRSVALLCDTLRLATERALEHDDEDPQRGQDPR